MSVRRGGFRWRPEAWCMTAAVVLGTPPTWSQVARAPGGPNATQTAQQEGRAEEGDRVETVAAPTDQFLPPPRGIAIWVAPPRTLLDAFNKTFSLVLGAQFPLERTTDIVVRGLFQTGTQRMTAVPGETNFGDQFVGYQASLGISHVFFSRSGYSGPVLLPSVIAGYRSVSEHYRPAPASPGNLAVRGQSEWQLGGGLDVGYQFSDRLVFLTVVVGFSVAHCWNCTYSVAVPGGEGAFAREHRRGSTIDVQFNFDLFRLGIHF
jgi:hypothetical protein